MPGEIECRNCTNKIEEDADFGGFCSEHCYNVFHGEFCDIDCRHCSKNEFS